MQLTLSSIADPAEAVVKFIAQDGVEGGRVETQTRNGLRMSAARFEVAREKNSLSGRVLAVRDGDWKLAMTYDAKRVELHQLTNDRAEAKDCAKEHPEIVERLSKLALEWKSTLPGEPNPECISKEQPKPKGKTAVNPLMP